MNEEYDFLKLAQKRFSVRKFSNKPIESNVIAKILEAGRLAPTACNRQPQRILVIQSDEAIKKLRMCTPCHFDAPAAMLVCYDKTQCWQREFDTKLSGDIDASIVTTHMMLEASALGVGTTWVMYFIPEAIQTEFELPINIEPVALLVMGYPAADAEPSERHLQREPLESTVFFNNFNNALLM